MIKNKKTNSVFIGYLFEIMLISLACLPHIYSHMPNSTWLMMGAIAFISLYQALKIGLIYNAVIRAWWFFFFVSLFGCIYTSDISYALGYVMKLFVLILSLSYFSKYIDTECTFKWMKLFVGISVAAVILEIFFPYQIEMIRNIIIIDSSSVSVIAERISAYSAKYGLFADTAVTAFFCVTGIGIGIYYIICKKKLNAIMWLTSSCVGLILTNKRGPMLAAVIAIVIIYILRSNSSWNTKIKAIFFISVSLIIIIYLFNTNSTMISWINRLNSNIYSTQNRAILYTNLWDNFIQHPLLGNGTKSSRELLNGVDGHNIYLAALCENGVIGLIVLLVALFVSVKKTIYIMNFFRRVQDSSAEALTTLCLFMQIYIIGYGMTGNPLSNLYSLAMYFLCVGLPLRLYRNRINILNNVRVLQSHQEVLSL